MLLGKTTRSESKCDRYTTFELYQKETEILLDSQNRVDSVVKGERISKSPNTLKKSLTPKGEPISNYPQFYAKFNPFKRIPYAAHLLPGYKAKKTNPKVITKVSSPVLTIETNNNLDEIPKPQILSADETKTAEPLKKKEKIKKVKAVRPPKPLDEVDSNPKSKKKSTKPESLSVESQTANTNVIVEAEAPPMSEKDKALEEIRKNLLEERQKDKEKCALKYQEILGRLKLNEDLLTNLIHFPLLPKEFIFAQENQSMYNETELRLSGEKLFQITPHELSHKIWKFPSVSTILDMSASDEKYNNLIKWKMEHIYTLGLEGFRKQSDATRKKGTDFHRSIERMLKHETLAHDELTMCVASAKKIIQSEFQGNMLLIEKNIFHDKLFYNGRIDSLGYYKDCLCLIDWKQSEKTKPTLRELYNAPIQMASYVGAFLSDSNHESIRRQHKIKNALIINVTDKGETNVHLLNYQQIEFYWFQWLSNLKKFWSAILQEKQI